jgi:hypothetical protein
MLWSRQASGRMARSSTKDLQLVLMLDNQLDQA